MSITTRRATYRRVLDVYIPPEVTIRNKNSTGLVSLTGVIQADHIKSPDWYERDVRYAGDMPNVIVNKVLQNVGTLAKICDVQ